MYELPVEMRDELKKPFGEVVDEQSLLNKLKGFKKIVAVGDVAVLTLFRKGIVPDIAIVDFKTKREEFKDLEGQVKEIGESVIKVSNPAGVITRELWQAVATAYSRDVKTRIEVEGEEDLAALPCIFLAGENVAVVYGQPDEGIVIVKVSQELRMKVRDILNRMEV